MGCIRHQGGEPSVPLRQTETGLQLYKCVCVSKLVRECSSVQMTVRDAINSAIDEELARDSKVFVLGEEVRHIHMLDRADVLFVFPLRPCALAFASDSTCNFGRTESASCSP